MTKKEDMEQMLLSSASLDELIRMKMEAELKNDFDKAKQKPKERIITNIADAPKHLIFSKSAVYKLFNRKTRTETNINGVQAEALTGLQTSIRDRMKEGMMDAFSTDDVYVKFEYVKAV